MEPVEKFSSGSQCRPVTDMCVEKTREPVEKFSSGIDV